MAQPRTLRINNATQTVTAPDDMPLLWVLRDILGMTGTGSAAASRNAAPACGAYRRQARALVPS